MPSAPRTQMMTFVKDQEVQSVRRSLEGVGAPGRPHE